MPRHADKSLNPFVLDGITASANAHTKFITDLPVTRTESCSLRICQCTRSREPSDRRTALSLSTSKLPESESLT
eukprot:2107641-Rhodomonas_salina.1